MSRAISMENFILLLVPTFLGLIFILFAILSFFSSKNIVESLVSGFFLTLGTLILLFSLREFKIRREGMVVIKHDERSYINRLKANDWGFRFFFVSLAFLILLNTLDIIDEIIFVAITGPIITIGVAISYIGFYLFERKG